MKRFVFLWPVACLTFTACTKKEEPAPKPAAGNPVTAPVDYLGAVAKGQQTAVKTLGAVSLDSAIKAFFDQESRYPKDLNELVTSGVLPKLPTAPAGMKFDYDPATGRAKVVKQ